MKDSRFFAFYAFTPCQGSSGAASARLVAVQGVCNGIAPGMRKGVEG